MKLSETLINSFKIGKDNRIYRGTDKDIVEKENILRAAAIKILVMIPVLIVVVTMCISNISNVSTIKSDIKKYYPAEFSNKTVYMVTEVSTINVLGYDKGFIKTNSGPVQTDKKPKSDVVTVYKDINNSYQSVENINKGNIKGLGSLTYIIRGYQADISKAVVLDDDVTKVKYKAFIRDASKLKFANTKLIFISILTLISFLGLAFLALIELTMAKKITNLLSNNFESTVVLEDGKDELEPAPALKSRETTTVEINTEEEVKSTPIGSAIANEGGIFTGIEGEDGKDGQQ